MNRSSTTKAGHYGRVFCLSFSPPSLSSRHRAIPERRDQTTTKTTEKEEITITRILASAGEDDCCRLWTRDIMKESEDELISKGKNFTRKTRTIFKAKSDLATLRGHTDAILKCEFGEKQHHNDGRRRNECKTVSNDGEEDREERYFALATGSANGEVFVWDISISGEGDGTKLVGRFLAKTKRGRKDGLGDSVINEDYRTDDDNSNNIEDEDNNNNSNEVYGLKFLDDDRYLVVATDTELIALSTVGVFGEEGNVVKNLEVITRIPLSFTLVDGDNTAKKDKFEMAYAFTMDAYKGGSSSAARLSNKHVIGVGYSNGTMRMYCFDVNESAFYLVGENESVFDNDYEIGRNRKNLACTSLAFINPTIENENEEIPKVLLCNRFGVVAMTDTKNWIEKTHPRTNIQTDFALTHSLSDVGNGIVAMCGRIKSNNEDGIAIFDAYDVQRCMFLSANDSMGANASMHPLLCVSGYAEEDIENENKVKLTIVAAGGVPAKLVSESLSNKSNVKSLGFSLAKMMNEKDEGDGGNERTSPLYVWEISI